MVSQVNCDRNGRRPKKVRYERNTVVFLFSLIYWFLYCFKSIWTALNTHICGTFDTAHLWVLVTRSLVDPLIRHPQHSPVLNKMKPRKPRAINDAFFNLEIKSQHLSQGKIIPTTTNFIVQVESIGNLRQYNSNYIETMVWKCAHLQTLIRMWIQWLSTQAKDHVWNSF